LYCISKEYKSKSHKKRKKMRYKKLKLSAILLLGLGLTGLQAQTMYVKQTSGTQTAYLLNNIRKLDFSSGNITVHKTAGMPDTYSLTGLRYLNFQDLTTTIAMLEKQEGTMRLYPNPVADVLNIQQVNERNQVSTIEILTIDGRLVYKEKQKTHENATQINVSGLPQGLYLCKIHNEKRTETTKFIKK
jgi:hypothetical protein